MKGLSKIENRENYREETINYIIKFSHIGGQSDWKGLLSVQHKEFFFDSINISRYVIVKLWNLKYQK